MTIRNLVLALLLTTACSFVVTAQGTRMLRHPAVSRDLVAFEYAGDLWAVSRNGGAARRLTSTLGMDIDPYFSPDGSQIAFTSTVAGNTDIYVMPATGGNPRRVTFHPAPDRVQGWTPDGRNIIFNSLRENAPQDAYFRIWKVSAAGGQPESLPLPSGFAGSYSPDGNKFSYQEFPMLFIPQFNEISFWRHYRGGRVNPIKVLNLADNSVERLPWTDSNDSSPMWIGNTIYFISDRDFNANLFAYQTDTKKLTKVTNHDDFDIMNASSGADAVVYEQAGYIHLLDAKTGKSTQLNIEVKGDLPMTRPQFKKVEDMIRKAALSPSGVRAAFEARGDIFTVPSAKGDYRNLTATSGAHEREPTWSPDGNQIAWMSDASGEYQMLIGDPLGVTEPRVINLPSTAYFSNLSWSPNGEQMLMQDNHANVWTIDVKSGAATKVDTDQYPNAFRNSFEASWSPDSKWITYSKNLKNRMLAIFVYSLSEKKSYQITDGLANSGSPAFDAGGKYLYFLASTDLGQRSGWVDMSSFDRTTRQSIYLVVLNSDEPSPFLPETGDEPLPKPTPAADETPKPKPTDETAKPKPMNNSVRIDFDGIRQRIISVKAPPADYSSLTAGAPGTFFYTELVPAIGAYRLQKFVVAANAAVPFIEGVASYTISADKKKLLYGARGNRWGIVGTDAPAKVGDGGINVAQMEMKVDPRAEWANIFRETWRIQREFFYDPKMQGADWNAIYKKYQPMLQYVGHREDLGYLIAQMGGELTVGHSYLTGAGDIPGEDPVQVGMLGADIAVENGKYKIKRIYNGENYNPELRSPLSSPGIDVKEGDFILEVNGKPLDSTTNFYNPFENTANRQTILRINNKPVREGSRLVTVIPVASDTGLRTRAWVEDNRRLVDKLSGGRLAYVWLPNTGMPGYTSFVRYFYAQQDKEGTIVDVRYNQGGFVGDFVINALERKPMGYFTIRDGEPFTSPIAGVFGPKVMLANETSGSGGDALPYFFKQQKLGPLIGRRTWGGLVGTTGVPPTIDGGGITAPALAFYNLDGKWDVENVGVAPDIEVENTPSEVMKGHDSQLERAVTEGLKLLEKNPVKRMPRPASINRVSKPKGGK